MWAAYLLILLAMTALVSWEFVTGAIRDPSMRVLATRDGNRFIFWGILGIQVLFAVSMLRAFVVSLRG